MKSSNSKKIELPTFLKWAGGKSKLINQMSPYFPEKTNTYIEPFLGGGAVLFYCLKYKNPKKVYAYDINAELINTYIQVRDKPSKLIEYLTELEKQHNASKDPKTFYYDRRTEFNTKLRDKIRKASLFIYLNKTCFNGLYRVNAIGEFNVPFGKYQTVKIFNEKTIREASSLLNNITLDIKDFRQINYPKKAFAYFDPPYWSEPHKNGFTSYHKIEFAEKEQTELRDLFIKLTNREYNLLLSNSSTKLIKMLYSNPKLTLIEIDARWMINCQGKKRNKLKELLIIYPKPEQQTLNIPVT